MEYKRLTNKYDNYYNCNAICKEQGSFLNKGCLAKSCGDCKHFEKILTRLGELEDKIENVTIIKLPCPRHTMVYVIGCISKKRKKYGIFEMPFTYDMIDSYQCNWFLTREQAEAKIKELKGEK